MNKPIMIIGQGALKGDEGEDYLNLCIELANNYNFLNNHWNGFNVLHTAASRPGAMEIGFLPGEGGKDLDKIIDGYKKGDISTLFLLGADEIEISEKQSKGLSQNSWIIVLIILTSLSLLFWYSLS